MSNFKEVKTGDLVLVRKRVRYGWGVETWFWVAEKVTKVTKTQFSVGPRRFSKDAGKEIGRKSLGYGEARPFSEEGNESGKMELFIKQVDLSRELGFVIDKLPNKITPSQENLPEALALAKKLVDLLVPPK